MSHKFGQGLLRHGGFVCQKAMASDQQFIRTLSRVNEGTDFMRRYGFDGGHGFIGRVRFQTTLTAAHTTGYRKNILEVTECSFDEKVLESGIPVIVDFYNESMPASKDISMMLEREVQDYDGRLLLAKVNVPNESSLALSLEVKSFPTVMAFDNGSVKRSFTGTQSDDAVRLFVAQAAAPAGS